MIKIREDFLHYLWQFKKFDIVDLKTTEEEPILIHAIGSHNISNPGPDFFNTQISINEQKWAGNVEIHVKSSDWYVHHHEKDPLYDNVILHVVWEDDIEIFRKDNSRIPSLQLSDYIDQEYLLRYQELFESNTKNWIPCEKQLLRIPNFTISNWQERLYLERLEQKAKLMGELLEDSANDWEAVLFTLLAKNFGLKVNGDSFLSLANSFDFSIVRKCSSDLNDLEALFFGQAGLLKNDFQNEYGRILIEKYSFLTNKFKLDNKGVLPFQFFRLRPPNFPTIRLSQLANLYFKNNSLFSEVIKNQSIEDFYTLFNIAASDFWSNHYTFEKESKSLKKKLTKSFVNLILINTIIPIKFFYAKTVGKEIEEEIMDLISQLPKEDNHIVNGFVTRGIVVDNAMHSQAMIQQKTIYCDQKACLKCTLGNYLLNQV